MLARCVSAPEEVAPAAAGPSGTARTPSTSTTTTLPARAFGLADRTVWTTIPLENCVRRQTVAPASRAKRDRMLSYAVVRSGRDGSTQRVGTDELGRSVLVEGIEL